MASNNGIILTNSPFYIVEAGASGFTSNLEIRIWNGAFASLPTDPTYEYKRQALSSSSTNVSFEISKVVRDSFEHVSNPHAITASSKPNSLWLNVRTFSGTANRDDNWLVVDGYSDFLDGINYQPTDVALLSERILYHYDNIPLRFPVYVDGSSNANTVEFRLGASVVDTETYTSLTSSDKSYDKIQYPTLTGFASGTVDNVVIKNSVGTIIETLTIESTHCSKYTPHIVTFINRFGVNQEMVFSLVSKSSTTVKKDSFQRQILEFNGGVPSYSTQKHVNKDYNVTVRDSIKLNTNYIDESLNGTLGELISSEAVWITVDGVTFPVNVKTTSLNYKKSINEGLISYTLDFDYSFDTRNTI